MNGHYEWIWICVDDSHYLSIRVERVDILIIRCSALATLQIGISRKLLQFAV